MRVKLGWSRKRGGKRKPGIEWEEEEQEGERMVGIAGIEWER